MSGFVHLRQKHKSLVDRFLHDRPFRRVDKTGLPIFHLSKIACLLSNIVCISMYYMSNRHLTFAVDKIHKR
jgi:hypothetical protein